MTRRYNRAGRIKGLHMPRVKSKTPGPGTTRCQRFSAPPGRGLASASSLGCAASQRHPPKRRRTDATMGE
jgi:hypothetical protein